MSRNVVDKQSQWNNCDVMQGLNTTRRTLQQNSAGSDGYFVTVSPDGNFALNCQKFFVAGWNE